MTLPSVLFKSSSVQRIPFQRLIYFPSVKPFSTAHVFRISPSSEWRQDETPSRPRDLSDKERHWLSLLRQLLREIRLLPDPASRRYLQSYVLSRFRSAADGPSNRHSANKKHANRGLKDLQKANEGYMPMLLNVLMKTYGRTGRRRRELFAPLTIPSDSEIEEIQHHNSTSITSPILKGLPSLRPENEPRIPTMTPRLIALLNSQKRTMNSTLKKGERIRKLEPTIAAKNAWERPMPQIRQITGAKKHHKMLLLRALPPLPANEWEHLRRLALGIEKPEDLDSKLWAASERKFQNHESDNSDLGQMMGNTHDLQRQLHLDKAKLSGGRIKPHNVNMRTMRRLWAEVFQICPRMDWDSTSQRWQIEWGKDSLRRFRKQKKQQDMSPLVEQLGSDLRERDEAVGNSDGAEGSGMTEDVTTPRKSTSRKESLNKVKAPKSDDNRAPEVSDSDADGNSDSDGGDGGY